MTRCIIIDHTLIVLCAMCAQLRKTRLEGRYEVWELSMEAGSSVVIRWSIS